MTNSFHPPNPGAPRRASPQVGRSEVLDAKNNARSRLRTGDARTQLLGVTRVSAREGGWVRTGVSTAFTGLCGRKAVCYKYGPAQTQIETK